MASNKVHSELIDVVFETLRAHVDAMTPGEQVNFAERILSLSPTPVANSPEDSSSSSDIPATPKPSIIIKNSRRKASRSKPTDKVSKGKKKVLNAFMAYRAYIAPILTGLPQKARSPMLSLMWRAEQRKGQFNLLGATYSKVRDECSDCPPLDKFLEVASRALSIIPADQYLELTGWAIVGEGDNRTLQSIPTNDNQVVAAFPLHTNASVQDIIQHCFDQGLLCSMPQTPAAQTQHLPEMSFAALPQNHDLTPEPEVQSVEDPFMFIDFDNAMPVNGYSPSIESVTQDQQQAYLSVPGALHWSPDIQPPVLGFDPNTIQNDFDPFSYNVDYFGPV